MTRFRPCIDLHQGKVKQIVGGSWVDEGENVRENHTSSHSADHFARLYAENRLTGGHVIQLGPGNEQAARQALAAWPDGLQIGGGIDSENAESWLIAGASQVIVTSWLFDDDGNFLENRLQQLVNRIGVNRLVIDLSCRTTQQGWQVAMNRWQTLTEMKVDHETLDYLSDYSSEFLIHAADVEGLCSGIDEDLVRVLGEWGKIPITYAGGARSLADVQQTNELSDGKVDITIGSALDIFGGSGVHFRDLVRWNQTQGA